MHEIQIHYERPLLAKDVFYQIKLEYQSVRYLSSVIQTSKEHAYRAIMATIYLN